jgi:hypothetical protein
VTERRFPPPWSVEELEAMTRPTKSKIEAIKPDQQDFNAVKKEYGPLPPTAGQAALAERYRLAPPAIKSAPHCAHSLTDILFTERFLHFNPFWLAERYRSTTQKSVKERPSPFPKIFRIWTTYLQQLQNDAWDRCALIALHRRSVATTQILPVRI